MLIPLQSVHFSCICQKKVVTLHGKRANDKETMQSIKKSIEFFSGEKYRNLDYGTIYYVAGTVSSEINEYVLSQIDSIEEHLNQNASNWVSCKIVYLTANNPLFPSRENAALYSAMMPEDDIFIVTDDNNFLVATLIDCEPKNINEAFAKYFFTLQKMYDEVLDEGRYKPENLGLAYLGFGGDRISLFDVPKKDSDDSIGSGTDDGIRYCIVSEDNSEDSIASGIDNDIRFSVTSGKPQKEEEEDFSEKLRKLRSAVTGEKPSKRVPNKGLPGDGTLLSREYLDIVTQKQDESPSVSTQPSHLVITPNTYQVLLPDYNKEFPFTTQVKALYILFLNHPEGIRIKEIADYKKEFTNIYLHVTRWGDVNRLKEIVDKLLNVWNRNALDAKKSQCNKIIRKTIPEKHLQKYYEIEVHPGEPHKINLDRSLVSMPDILKTK